MQALHVGLRYKALSVLQLPNLNQKRGAALVLAHVAGLPIPGMHSSLIVYSKPTSVNFFWHDCFCLQANTTFAPHHCLPQTLLTTYPHPSQH